MPHKETKHKHAPTDTRARTHPHTHPHMGARFTPTRRLGELQGMDGIDMLLQACAHYRKRAPSGEEEQECVENLFTSLCFSMLVPANQVPRCVGLWLWLCGGVGI